jgi:hypothetical protein
MIWNNTKADLRAWHGSCIARSSGMLVGGRLEDIALDGTTVDVTPPVGRVECWLAMNNLLTR